MDTTFLFTTWVGIALLTVSVVVAAVVAVMPFLVWGTHTRLREMESTITGIKMDVHDAKLTIDAIDAVLEDLVSHGTISGKTRATVENLKSHRYSAMLESALEAANRKLETLRDPSSPEAIKAARHKQRVEKMLWGILFAFLVLVVGAVIAVWLENRT